MPHCRAIRDEYPDKGEKYAQTNRNDVVDVESSILKADQSASQEQMFK